MPVPPVVPVMQMLADRLPLTLLLDLASPGGPPADEILRKEHADTSWLPAAVTDGHRHPGE